MSVPARSLPAPEPRQGPAVPGPRARPAARPAPARRPRARARRRRHLGFFLLSSVVVGSMVFGIVVLNVLLAQTAFRIDEAERRLEVLSQEHLELVREQATLSAPGRIATWASRHGMRLPDDIRILHARGEGPADPAGAGTSGTVAPEGSR